MLCFRCLVNSKENELKPNFLEGIEIDICLECGGIWFDKITFSKAIVIPKEKIADFYSKLDNLRQDSSLLNQDLILNCPKCDVIMNKYRYMYDSSIYIDSCNKCLGI